MAVPVEIQQNGLRIAAKQLAIWQRAIDAALQGKRTAAEGRVFWQEVDDVILAMAREMQDLASMLVSVSSLTPAEVKELDYVRLHALHV